MRRNPTQFPRPQAAAVDWILATPYALFLLTPWYNSFCSWAKERLPALWHQFFDDANPDRIVLSKVSRDGALRDDYSPTLSAWAPFRYGRGKSSFSRSTAPRTQFEKSICAYLDAMSAYAEGRTYQGIDFDTELDCYFGVILVTYDYANDRLRVVNPFADRPTDVIANQRRLEQERREHQ